MNNIDQKIQAALRRDGAGPDLLDEPNLVEEAITAFRGRNRAISTFAFIISFALFGGAVWAGWRFYGAETLQTQVQWGARHAPHFMVSFLKIWFWLEMHTNRVLRELKRVELLLSRSAASERLRRRLISETARERQRVRNADCSAQSRRGIAKIMFGIIFGIAAGIAVLYLFGK